MIIAAAIFACLVGIIYILWNQRAMQTRIDHLENLSFNQSSNGSSNMPSLDEVIEHYEKQLNQGDDEPVDEEPADEEVAEEEHADEEPVDEPVASDDAQEEQPNGESDDAQDKPAIQTLISADSPEEDIKIHRYSSIRARVFKEKCKELGFSYRGSKAEMIRRLLKHPNYNTEEKIIAALSPKQNDTAPPVEPESDDTTQPIEMEVQIDGTATTENKVPETEIIMEG